MANFDFRLVEKAKGRKLDELKPKEPSFEERMANLSKTLKSLDFVSEEDADKTIEAFRWLHENRNRFD